MANLKSVKNYKMMPGTTTGHYFPFARKGDILLGVKPEGIVPPGKMGGVPGATYFAAKIRSAPGHGLFAEEDAAKKVVTLQKQPSNLWDAWPKVTWSAKNTERASTVVGMFVKGDFADNPQQLVDSVGGGKLMTRLTDYLISLAGKENLIVSRDELKDWLDSTFEPTLANILKLIENQKAFQKECAASIGQFGMQADLLKKVYEAAKSGEDEEV